MGAAPATAAEPAMPRVFISYRRADSAGWVQLIDERLAPVLGKENLFCDIRSIGMGRDFEKEIQARVRASDVVLVLISQNWATMPGRNGRSRLFEPEDLVRREVELAIKAGVEIVPVLCGQVAMPSAQQLPTSMRALLKRQAFQISTRHMDRDLDDLAQELGRFQRRGSEARPRRKAELAEPAPAARVDTAASHAPEPAAADASQASLRPASLAAGVSAVPPPWQEASRVWAPADPRPGANFGERPLHLRVTSDADGPLLELVHAGPDAPPVPTGPVRAAGLSALQSIVRGTSWHGHGGAVADMGPVMFRMLVPQAWRALLAWSTGVRLTLDDDAQVWPWEWMWVPGEPLPLCMLRPLVRDAIDAPAPPPQRPVHRGLVVLGDAPRELYVELPGARAEVAAVEAAWRSRGIEVTSRIEWDAAATVHAVASTAYDAVHLSGHSATDWLPKPSETEARQQPLSGLVIGNAAVLTPQDLLLHEQPPELVTLATDGLGHWAPQLRRGGVRLVLACQNPLHDAPATAFFQAFHAALVAGRPAAHALQEARHAAARCDGDGVLVAVNMQCHGDADLQWPVEAPEPVAPPAPAARRRPATKRARAGAR